MGLQLPGELVSILGMLGYNWPEADEEKLFDMGQAWIDFASSLDGIVTQAVTHGQRVADQHTGDAIEAFQKRWNDPESPVNNLSDGSTGALLVGVGLVIAAGVVLVLKINVIVQLISLAIEIAQAIATAIATFGASLAEIPIFKMITSMIIDQLLGMAIGALLNG
jgi:hypothetical protein